MRLIHGIIVSTNVGNGLMAVELENRRRYIVKSERWAEYGQAVSVAFDFQEDRIKRVYNPKEAFINEELQHFDEDDEEIAEVEFGPKEDFQWAPGGAV